MEGRQIPCISRIPWLISLSSRSVPAEASDPWGFRIIYIEVRWHVRAMGSTEPSKYTETHGKGSRGLKVSRLPCISSIPWLISLFREMSQL